MPPTRPSPAPGGPARRAAIGDVARAAGVSVTTVSRVLNDAPDVGAATRERVKRVIADLGFVPSTAARWLSRGQSSVLTVLTTDVALYGYTQIVAGVHEVAEAHSIAVDVRLLPSDTADEVTTRNRLRGVLAPGIGPVIVVDYGPAAHVAAASLADKPDVVALVRSKEAAQAATGPRPPDRVMWLDEYTGMTLATRHLLALGHRTVHHVAVPHGYADERSSGWRETLLQAGSPVPEPISAGWDAASGYRAASVLGTDPTVTAVLCGNDDLALGVMKGLAYLGRTVPGDVSVMGFDGRPETEFYAPALSTVAMDWRGLGRQAAARALEVELPDGDGVRAPYLVPRASTAAAQG
ncbi:MAG TPA: LacI family DNA-binding transcriptional regulator [Cellulomonas sp.]